MGRTIQSQPILARIETLWAETVVTPEYLAAMRLALPPPGTHASHAALLSLPGLCCEAVGGEQQRANDVAGAWGLLYTAAHLLDSVEDGDAADEPWARWGPSAAINISTGLLASASLVLQELRSKVEEPVVAAVVGDFSRTILRMCSGQHADLTQLRPSLEQWWQVAEEKSGAFFALACRAGARLAATDAMRLDRFSQFGLHLGILIQIGDDIRGVFPKGGERGDLAAGRRCVLPIAYAMSVLSDPARAQLSECLLAAPGDASARLQVHRLIIESGAVLYLTIAAAQHRQQAETALKAAAPPSAARDALLTMLSAIAALGKV